MSRFLISCGGTGGHLSPGIALAEGLKNRGHEVTLMISRKKVDARLIEKYPQFDFERMPGTGFSWNPLGLARCLVSQVQALWFVCRCARRIRPQGLIGFGGFTSVGLIVAGALLGIPVVLHEANRVPGRAIRLLGRMAKRVYLPPGVRLSGVKSEVIRHMGLPVRSEIKRAPMEASRVALGLHPHGKVIAVLGGSQGASALNGWTRSNLTRLADEGIQIYCLTGLGKDQPETLELKSRTGVPVRAVFVPFSDRMAEIMSAADLVVSRAGAGTIAELVRCETPAILVPFPHAADDHQRANGVFFERQGGGLLVEQAFMATLSAEVLDTIFNDWLLRKFRGNLQRMERANSLELMLDDLESLVDNSARKSPPDKSGSAKAAALVA
jgi:UDP-N-acetylglucosamine--N-acetylmuramyl-(pentapeptide) pyrophosphoryl-undecaprenol N-acetylglucosamine transferase